MASQKVKSSLAMMLHTYMLWFLRYSLDKTLKATTARSKVRSRSCHDLCTPTPPYQCRCYVSTSYTLRFSRYSPHMILKIKILLQGQMSNKSVTMMLHICTSNQCPRQVGTSYKSRFQRYSQDKIFHVAHPQPTQQDSLYML